MSVLAPSSKLIIILAEESDLQQRIVTDLRDEESGQLLAVCTSVDEFIESRMDAYVTAVVIALCPEQQARFLAHREKQEKIYPIINIELSHAEPSDINWDKIPISETIEYSAYRIDIIRMALKYITELSIVLGEVKSLQQSVTDAEQTNNRFFQYMSHELSTPLYAARTLQDSAAKIECAKDLQENAKVTSVALTHVLDAINNITEYSRLNANQVSMAQDKVDIRSLITELLVLFSGYAEHKNIKLHADYSGAEDIFYLGDALRLRQVLVNIVKNAIKFTDEGEICIHIDSQDNNLTISVSDTGIGMTADRLHEIRSTDSYRPSSSNQGGLGLRLKISREFLYKSGGHLDIESVVDEGSRFTIHLPNFNNSNYHVGRKKGAC